MTALTAVFASSALALRLAGAALRGESRPESARAIGWLLCVCGTWCAASAAGGWLPLWAVVPPAAMGLIADLRLVRSLRLRIPIWWGVDAAIYAVALALTDSGVYRAILFGGMLALAAVLVDLALCRLTPRQAALLAVSLPLLWCLGWAVRPAALRSAVAILATQANYIGNLPAVLPERVRPADLSFVDVTDLFDVEGPDHFGGHGGQFADVDHDGWVDLYVTMNFKREMADLFYRNTGDGFVEQARERGIDSVDRGSHGAVWADLDGDGDYDLFNGSYDRNRIYINDGSGRFVDRTEASGMPDRAWATRGVAALDFDRDGDLDLFAVTGSGGTDPATSEHNEFYENLGAVRFQTLQQSALLTAPAGQGAIATDFDGDGFVDLVAGNRDGPLNLLRNNGARGFELLDPLALGILHRSPDGATSADIDQDGDLDLLLVGDPMQLYRNLGQDRFVYHASLHAPQRGTGSAYMGAFADLDNDSDLDLVFPGDGRVHLNDGVGNFRQVVTFQPGPIEDPRCVSFADIDNDGDLDFFYAQKRGHNRMIRNDYTGPNRWLKLELVSAHGVAGAFGARVRILTGNTLLETREARGSYGYLAQDDPVLHLGLGRHDIVDVLVDFPDGLSILRRGVTAGQTLRIDARQERLGKTGRLWGPPLEWTFHPGPNDMNPHDREIRASFEHEPSGTTLETHLYPVGDGRYQLRFSATRTGSWSFSVTSEDRELGFGRVSIEPPLPESRGFVVADGPHWSRSGSGRAFVPQLVMFAGPHHFYRKPEVVDAAIETFLVDHGFNGFHVPVFCRWFDLDRPVCADIVAGSPDPDPRTFEALEMMIEKVYRAGGMVHLWLWGDSQDGFNPGPRWGLNTEVDRRLQRYLLARLGPLPGWTMGYGFDIEEWADHEDLNQWRIYTENRDPWQHLHGARSIGPNVYDPDQPFPQPFDHAVEGMTYSSYDQVRPGYDAYAAAFDASPAKPSMSEDRFRMRDERRTKDYSMQDVRRGLWHSTMAGGVGNIWGNLLTAPRANQGLEPSASFPRPTWIRTWADFFEARFRAGLKRCNQRTDGVCLTLPEGTGVMLYQEDSASVRVDLTGTNCRPTGVAVDTLKSYKEIPIELSMAPDARWVAPYASDWALALGELSAPLPR